MVSKRSDPQDVFQQGTLKVQISLDGQVAKEGEQTSEADTLALMYSASDARRENLG